MYERGKLMTCDRCGRTAFFKCTGERETDGGHTRWSTFEEAVGWTRHFEYETGDLCPSCSEEFNLIVGQFKRSVKDFIGEEDVDGANS